MNNTHFPVIVELDEDGVFIVSCPTFRGCHSFGKTLPEAMANIRQVIELCLEEQTDENRSLNTFVGVRDIEVAAHA
ncbi:MAG: type II toxin-antitoxin system HicB family antitoxin [Candidatus Kapaibacteriota bacterium]|jgi:predicted RNase H-like HicB family nuclease